jgi:hypothetical protein
MGEKREAEERPTEKESEEALRRRREILAILLKILRA